MQRCYECMRLCEKHFEICPYCSAAANSEPLETLYIRPGTKLADRYVIGRALGSGGFGVTYVAFDEVLDRKVAVKEYLPSEFSTRIPGQTKVTVFSGSKNKQYYEGLKKFIEEAQRLAKFHDMPGIVTVYDSFEENNTAYIVMECLEGETLSERLERQPVMTISQSLDLLMPIMRSLEIIHKKGVIHRDIAPDNIFLTKDGKAKLIDFGAARSAVVNYSRSLTVIIKAGYSPEEQYRSRGDQGAHTDVYALAATLYRMLTGTVPPDALERRASMENMQGDPLVPLRAGSGTPANAIDQILLKIKTAAKNASRTVCAVRDSVYNPIAEKCSKKAEQPSASQKFWGAISRVLPVKITAAQPRVEPALSRNQALAIMNALNVKTSDRTPDMAHFIEELTGGGDVLRRESHLSSGELLRWPKWVRTAIPTAIALCVVLLILGLAGVFGGSSGNTAIEIPDNMTRVPVVVNSGVSQADVILEDAILDYRIVGNEYSDVVPADHLLEQNLSGGSVVMRNTVVDVVVSVGQRTETVPNVRGYDSAVASEKLEALGFKVSVQETPNSGIAKGGVISQSIASGYDYQLGGVITLTVSTGRPPNEATPADSVVPQLAGMSFDQAVNVAAINGLYLLVTEKAYSDSYPEDAILEQGLMADTVVAGGSVVRLKTSLGKDRVKIPDFIYMPEKDARDKAAQKRLVPVVEYSFSASVSAGLVMRQIPTARTWVSPNSEIQLVISKGPKPFAMPDVEKLSEEEAVAVLSDAGLVVSVSYAPSASVAEGMVMDQQPNAGEEVVIGSSVTVTVSSGQKLATVPSLYNMTENDAREQLASLGLGCSVNEVYNDSVARGRVISQSPEGGTVQLEGTVVYINVSLGKRPSGTTTTARRTTTTTRNTTTTKQTTKTTTTTTTTRIYTTTTTTTTTKPATTTRPTM